MYTTYAKHLMLNALVPDQVSLHTAYPGTTGANEVTGGTYARLAPSVATAAGEVRTQSALTFDVPATTVRWVGEWQSGNLLAISPNGGSPKEFMADPAANTIICPAHGWADGDTITFYSATPPAPLAVGTVYYVVGSATNTFQVSATTGGAAIDLTDYGSGGCQVSRIYEDVYASAGTHEISSGTFGLPF